VVIVVAAGLLLSGWAGRQPAPPPSLVVRGAEDIPGLVALLRSRGLVLRLASTRAHGDIHDNAFLLARARTWAELNRLVKARKYAEQWRGIVFCECVRDPFPCLQRTEIEAWGDCCLQAPPFLFFGDPELIALIRDALLDPRFQAVQEINR
jgi:hypothetical protein